MLRTLAFALQVHVDFSRRLDHVPPTEAKSWKVYRKYLLWNHIIHIIGIQIPKNNIIEVSVFHETINILTLLWSAYFLQFIFRRSSVVFACSYHACRLEFYIAIFFGLVFQTFFKVPILHCIDSASIVHVGVLAIMAETAIDHTQLLELEWVMRILRKRYASYALLHELISALWYIFKVW